MKKKDALIDPTGKYRYWLLRQWNNKPGNFVNFVMLNPSKADAEVDDNTIRRCVKYAKKWGFDGIYVTNLFAFRATDPKCIKKASDPIGKENNKYIKLIAKKSKLIVLAWSNHGSFMQRDMAAIKILSGIHPLRCLGTNKSGQPKHPLRLNKNLNPVRYKYK